MNNKYTKEIKKEMKVFREVNYPYDIKLANVLNLYDYNDLDPQIIGNIFSNILNFKIVFHPFEKIDYILSFKYNNKIFRVEHRKMSFELFGEDDSMFKEIISIFMKCIKLYEEALFKYSKSEVKNGNFSLNNYYDYYQKKLSFIENEISKLIIYYNRTLKNKDYLKSSIFRTKLSNMIELYYYNVYSYIEHIICLIIPLLDIYIKYDYIEKINNCRSFKIKDLNNHTFDNIAECFEELKCKYRNRLGHGMITHEKLLIVNAPGLRYIPFWMGDKYCQGFTGPSLYMGKEEYVEMKKLLLEFNNKLDEEYTLEMNIIKNTDIIYLDNSKYIEALKDEESNSLWIDMYNQHIDDLVNMDW